MGKKKREKNYLKIRENKSKPISISSLNKELKLNPQHKLMIIIFLLALIVRITFLIQSSANPTFNAPVVDSNTYDQMARNLVQGNGLSGGFFWQPLLYPLFLSFIYLITNSSILAVKIVQIIIGSFTCVVVFRLGEKLFSRKAGLLAGIIIATYMPLVFFECELLAASLATLCTSLLLLMFIKTGENPDLKNSILLGLLGGISIVTRPVFLPFFASSCIWLAVLYIKKRMNTKKLAFIFIYIAIGFLTITIPAGITTYINTGNFKFIPYSGGINFYIGNNPNYEKTIAIRPGLEWRELTSLPFREEGIIGNKKTEQYFSRKTIEHFFTEPINFIKRLLYKAAQFVTARELPRNIDIYYFRNWSDLLKIGVWKIGRFGFPFSLLFVLAVIGAIYWFKKIPIPFWLFLLFYPASVILVFVASRYRIPTIPALSILAASGCFAVRDIIQKRNIKKIALFAGIFLITMIIVNIAPPFYEEKVNYEAELYYGLGASLKYRGKSLEAGPAYLKAIQLNTNYAEAHYNLANLYKSQRNNEKAELHYRKALKIKPDNAEIHNNLGAILRNQGKREEAISHFKKVIQINPYSAQAYNNIGIIMGMKKDIDGAIKNFHAALEISPNSDRTHFNLGLALELKGDFIGARKQYQRVLEINPNYTQARKKLNRLLK